MASTNDIVLGVWAVSPFRKSGKYLGTWYEEYLSKPHSGCGWLCAWQWLYVDPVAMNIILSSKLHQFASINSSHFGYWPRFSSVQKCGGEDFPWKDGISINNSITILEWQSRTADTLSLWIEFHNTDVIRWLLNSSSVTFSLILLLAD